MLVRLWRRLFGQGWFRVSGDDPSTVLPCDWCGDVGPTTIDEIWSGAFPDGSMKRLCENCKLKCARG